MNATEEIFMISAIPGTSQPSTSAQKLDELELPGGSQVNLENVKDFSHVCRTCATITEFVIPIFAGEGLQNNLADKIHKHLPIQVCEGDKLPQVLCYQCSSTLLAWHELVQCCLQADAALQARVASGTLQEPKSSNVTSNAIDNEEQTKYSQSDTAEYSVARLQPPQYRACDYCWFTARDLPQFKEHLITAHSDLLFYCEECDKYIGRKDFILHMSLHAVQYTSGQDKTVKRKKIRKKEEDDNRSNSELRKSREDLDTANERINNSENSNQENEFSDHSDMDYEFGPLPESVFEAIEDSQDSQVLDNDDIHAAENGRVSDESNKTIRLTIESNTITSTEMHSLSNCALTIEHNSTVSVTVSSNIVENTTTNEDSCNTREHGTTANEDSTASGAITPDTMVNGSGEECNNGKKQHKKTRICPICGKVYTASSSYFYHMKYFHRGSREHECEVCGKKFTTKPSLTQHMAIHTEQYAFECKVCEKKFKFKASLYIHEQTHSGKKVWSCNQCHRSFRWRTHLARHMKRHASEKTHICATCGRGFSVHCDLLRHARTHTIGSFSCDKCGQKFAQLRYLKVHVARQHSICRR